MFLAISLIIGKYYIQSNIKSKVSAKHKFALSHMGTLISL